MGIKAYVLAGSDTGYSVAIYYGKETMLVSHPGLNYTTSVVLTLVQPVCNMGYDLSCVYTSQVLTRDYLSRDHGCGHNVYTHTCLKINYNL